jgi:hypothetical protein
LETLGLDEPCGFVPNGCAAPAALAAIKAVALTAAAMARAKRSRFPGEVDLRMNVLPLVRFNG